jgi:site-specific DNA recombinase
MRKVAGYIRVSSEEQSREGSSLPAQRARIEAYCTMRALDLVEIVEDPGVSASKALAARAGGRHLLEILRRRRVSGIVAFKLDRLFRNCGDCLTNVESWDRAGVALHLIDLGGSAIDTSTAAGKFFLTVMAGAAELERNQISERTSAVLRHKASRGEYTGGEPPYGFRVGSGGVQLVEDPGEQRVIARARELRVARVSLRRIAAQLAAEGMASRVGRPFAIIQIQRLVAA